MDRSCSANRAIAVVNSEYQPHVQYILSKAKATMMALKAKRQVREEDN